MVALAGIGGDLHLAQQGVHLRGCEAATGADRAVAGQGRAHLLQALTQGQGLARLGQVVGDVADQARHVGLAQQGGGLAHQDGAGAEGLHHQAQGLQLLRPAGDALGLRRVQLHHLGQEQGLSGHTAGLQLGLHPLIDQALVGGVLVHHHQAVPGLGDDVGGVDLGPGRAQGLVEGLGVGRDLAEVERGPRIRQPRRQLGPARQALQSRQDGAAARSGDGVPTAHPPGREAGRRRAGGITAHPLRAKGRQGGVRVCRGAAVGSAGQGVPQPPHHQAADQGRVAEPNLRLGWVDIDVHGVGVDLQVEGRHRMPVPGQEVGIGAAQGALQQAVAHRPAVDEQVLVRG